MEDYQLRVIEERKELARKHFKLQMFMAHEPFQSLPHHEQVLLRVQSSVMQTYLTVLEERIKGFQTITTGECNGRE